MATIKIQTGLRLDEETYEKLKALSLMENRSLNNLAEYIIKKYLSDYENAHGELPVSQD